MLSRSSWAGPTPAETFRLARGTITDVVFRRHPVPAAGPAGAARLARREPLDDRLAGDIADALSRRIDHGERDRVRRQ